MPPLLKFGTPRSLGTQMSTCFLLRPVVLDLGVALRLGLALVLVLTHLLLMSLTSGGLTVIVLILTNSCRLLFLTWHLMMRCWMILQCLLLRRLSH